MNWIEAVIYTTTEGIEPITGNLLQIGVGGFVIEDAKDFEEFLTDTSPHWDYVDNELMRLKEVETSVKLYLADNLQGKEMLESIKQCLTELKKFDTENQFGRLEMTLVNVKEEDWENNWKQYFKPFEVGEKFVIKPSWENYDKPTDRIILEIDPSSSFGTGTHATTQLCMIGLEQVVTKGAAVLDLGCGSGILSIAAVLLGADKITAADIDENSTRICRENAEKNDISEEQMKIHCGNIIGNEPLQAAMGYGCYDVVVANIVADVIIAMSHDFKKFLKPDGKLITSGIISERKDEVLSALEAAGFVVTDVREDSDWAAIFAKMR